MYTFFMKSKVSFYVIISLTLLLEKRALPVFEKKNFIQRIEKLNTKLYNLDRQLKEDLLDLYEAYYQQVSYEEQHTACKNFVKTYFEYNQLDLEVSHLFALMASDPLKFCKFLNLSSTQTLDRNNLNFIEPFMFTQMDLELLEEFSSLFYENKQLQSAILSIQNIRAFLLN